MKTMNYLCTLFFVLFLSACTNENDSIDEELEATQARGGAHQEPTIYLELDFHQSFLLFEEQQIRSQMVKLEEKLEDGDEGHELLEELQQRLARNMRTYQMNEELLNLYLRGPIGGGRPGRPCGVEPNPLGVCPPPKRHLEDMYLYMNEWAKGTIEVLTFEGEVCGAMVKMEPVSGADEQFARAILEYDADVASQIRFTKLSSNGEELISYTLPIE